MKNDSTLYLAWQDPRSRLWFPIGRLTFEDKQYHFVYLKGAIEAQKKGGFEPLLSFPELSRKYTSTELFPVFSNRLMSRSRPEYPKFIHWLNMPQDEDDPIALLARSGGRRETDTLTVFPGPEPNEEGKYHIHFFSHGLRYLPECAIERINRFQPGDKLLLAHEFQNPYDPQALTLNTEDHHIVGYCPRYLGKTIFQLLSKEPNHVNVFVERVNPRPTPLQFRLLCSMTADWVEGFCPFTENEYQPISDEISTNSVHQTAIG